MLVVEDVLSRCRDILQDTEEVRWTTPELLQWVNDVLALLVFHVPDANSVLETHIATAGVHQSLLSGAVLIDVEYNINQDDTPGRTVRVVDKDSLAVGFPDWRSATAGATKHFMFNPKFPLQFDVYPPAEEGAKLLVRKAQYFDVVDETYELPIPTIYASAAMDYVLFRAFSKDAEYAQDAGRAAQYERRYMTALGMKVSGARALQPTRSE
jgi:hypothetical protein